MAVRTLTMKKSRVERNVAIARIAKLIPGWTFPLTWAVSMCGDVVWIMALSDSGGVGPD